MYVQVIGCYNDQFVAPHFCRNRQTDNTPVWIIIFAGHKESIQVRSVVGDVRKLTELRIATRDVTTVIHAAGVISFGTFPDNGAMNEINAKGRVTVSLLSPVHVVGAFKSMTML